MPRVLRILAKVAVLSGVAYLLYRLVQRAIGSAEPPVSGEGWTPLEPLATEPTPSTEIELAPSTEIEVSGAPWVAPVDGACPASHPVKAKQSSQIFHVPGGLNYDRTNPDRCYLGAEAAEADGYRQSKR